MTNASASSYIDAITRSGKPIYKSDAKVLEIIKDRIFRNKDLTASQAEALRDIHRNSMERGK
jgi:hypothetical protein